MTTPEAVALIRLIAKVLKPHVDFGEETIGAWAHALAAEPGLSAAHAQRAFYVVFSERLPSFICPADVLAKARDLEPDDRPLGLPAPPDRPPRRIPGVAPTSVDPRAFAQETKRHFPIVRTTGEERGLMNAQGMRQHEASIEFRRQHPSRHPATFSSVGELLGNWKRDAKALFQSAIERHQQGGPWIAGTYCDWCGTALASVADLDQWFDWIEATRGSSPDDRAFCNDCAHRALVEEARP